MPRFYPVRALSVLLTFTATLAAQDAAPTLTYPLTPDSLVREGVPRGELIDYTFDTSAIYPGTTRKVVVYVPAQYDPTTPACVYIGMDGVQFKAPTVFDNLIAAGDMPVTIGIFITPGVVPAPDSETAQDRFNRSFEYDALGDAYARFLLEEILPDVQTRTTTDGRAIRLSDSGNDRLIAGLSSSAICAFTAAWERPDAFSRVFSVIGTYVSLRGGHAYENLVRKTEPKPLRIFLQDGSADLNLYAGNWFLANQQMLSALTFAGYDVTHEWGTLGHNLEHANALFPQAMRWLWRDWPAPIEPAAPTSNATLQAILEPGENWELVGDGYGLSEGAAVDADGAFYFTDIRASTSYRLDAEGRPLVHLTETGRANGQAFGPDGTLYQAAGGAREVVAHRPDGTREVVASGWSPNDLVVAHNGNLYVTNPGDNARKVWLIRPNGSTEVVDQGLRYPNGIALSPDQTQLYVADYFSHWVYVYQIQPDGTLAHKQRFFWLHQPDDEDQSFADGIKVDRAGNVYVATRLGIQVCDPIGRVHAILPTPNGLITNLVFGGPDFDVLYATCNEKVYRRKMKTSGVNAWAPPFKLPKPRL